MKHALPTLVVILSSLQLFAQEEPPSGRAFEMPRTLVKMAPLKFFERNFELGIESFNKNYTRSINFDLGFKSGDEDFNEARGYNAEIGYRRYAPSMKFKSSGDRNYYRGIYYSLSVRAQYFKGEEFQYGSSSDVLRQKTTSIAPAFTLGWQRTLWEALVLDIYVGGAVRFAETEYPDGPIEQHQDVSIFNPRYEGIMPKVGVKLGIGW